MFAVELQQKMAELGVEMLYNADQTLVYFKTLLTKMITTKMAKTV